VFEAKFGGFQAAADTASGRSLLGNGNWMQRFEEVLHLLLGATCSMASLSRSMMPGGLCSTSFCLAVALSAKGGRFTGPRSDLRVAGEIRVGGHDRFGMRKLAARGTGWG
jgi:hypothetical protein